MNPLNLPSELPIARYRLHFTLTHDLQLPSYAASTLRGVFGHALLAAACTCDTPQTPHLPDCPYAQIFEPAPCADLPGSVRQSPPPPYLIETPLVAPTHFPAGAGYAFDLVLFGRARHSLPLIAAVFAQAFAKGLGANNAGKGELSGIAVQQVDGSFLTISERGSPIALPRQPYQAARTLSHPSAYSAADASAYSAKRQDFARNRADAGGFSAPAPAPLSDACPSALGQSC